MPKAKKKLTSKKTIAKKSIKKVVKKAAKNKSKKVKVTAIPKGYNSITPYLIVSNGSKAIDFYKKIFGAKEMLRMERSGKIAHAELKIGDAKIMLADACPEMGARTPEEFGGSPVSVHLYIKNVDAVINNAVSAGAKLEREIQNMFFGDRSGTVTDPFGHKWTVSTHIEDVTPAKIKKRAAEMFGE